MLNARLLLCLPPNVAALVPLIAKAGSRRDTLKLRWFQEQVVTLTGALRRSGLHR